MSCLLVLSKLSELLEVWDLLKKHITEIMPFFELMELALPVHVEKHFIVRCPRELHV